jgi:hypothetical protein
MEHYKRDIELRSTQLYDSEDYFQECNAYQKIKLFMAKRIAEQQAEIEALKEQVMYHSIMHTQLYDVLKQINENLQNCQNLKQSTINNDGFNIIPEDDKINLSGELIDSLVYDEDKKTSKNNSVKNENLNEKNTDKNEKFLTLLKNENLELRKQLENSKSENLVKNSQITKLANDKFLLFTELNELVMSLRKVDLNLLNKFYLSNIPSQNLNKKLRNEIKPGEVNSNVITSMGLKYNILSAQSQLALLANKNGEIDNTRNLINNISFTNSYINIDNCLTLIKSYEDELNRLISDHVYNGNQRYNSMQSTSTRAYTSEI